MSKENKKFLVQLIGPAGVVKVSGKLQRFIEEAPSSLEVERRLVDRKMDIDPITGSYHYGGKFIGCWIDVRELPDPHTTR